MTSVLRPDAARWWRRGAVVASGLAFVHPSPMAVAMLFGPFLPHAPGMSRWWDVLLWPFTVVGGLLIGGVEVSIAAPAVGTAVAVLWLAAWAVPPGWAAWRARLVLETAGAAGFGLAGAGRVLLLAYMGFATRDVPARIGPAAVLPMAALGAAAGACLAAARVRAVPGD